MVFHRTKLQRVRIQTNRYSCFNNFVFSVGSCAHLTSFYGTDTISGCVLAKKYYLANDIVGFSIPASEHSTMVSWTRDKEREAYENFLGKFMMIKRKSISLIIF